MKESDHFFSLVLSLVRTDRDEYTRGWTDGFLIAVVDHLEGWQLVHIKNIIHARRNLGMSA